MKKYLCLIALSTLSYATITNSDLPKLKVVSHETLNAFEKEKLAWQALLACQNLNNQDKKNIAEAYDCPSFISMYAHSKTSQKEYSTPLYLMHPEGVIGATVVHEKSCTILRFFIIEAARGSGAANLLMQGVFENLSHCKHINVHAAEKATSFYKKNGFQSGFDGKRDYRYGPLMTAQNPSYQPQK